MGKGEATKKVMGKGEATKKFPKLTTRDAFGFARHLKIGNLDDCHQGGEFTAL